MLPLVVTLALKQVCRFSRYLDESLADTSCSSVAIQHLGNPLVDKLSLRQGLIPLLHVIPSSARLTVSCNTRVDGHSSSLGGTSDLGILDSSRRRVVLSAFARQRSFRSTLYHSRMELVSLHRWSSRTSSLSDVSGHGCIGLSRASPSTGLGHSHFHHSPLPQPHPQSSLRVLLLESRCSSAPLLRRGYHASSGQSHSILPIVCYVTYPPLSTTIARYVVSNHCGCLVGS